MTLEELEAFPRDWLTCSQVAEVLGAKSQNIHDQAVTDPLSLGFPVVVIKSRVKIPKKAFLRLMRDGVVADAMG